MYLTFIVQIYVALLQLLPLPNAYLASLWVLPLQIEAH